MVEHSNAMQDQVNELARHMNVVTDQNFKLSNELQSFLTTDEMVRSQLNRSQGLNDIKQRVD